MVKDTHNPPDVYGALHAVSVLGECVNALRDDHGQETGRSIAECVYNRPSQVNTGIKVSKGKFLYNAISKPQNYSVLYTSLPRRPVQTNTISASVGSIHVVINAGLKCCQLYHFTQNAVSCTMSLRMLSAVPCHSECCQLYHVTQDAVRCTMSLRMLSAVPCYSECCQLYHVTQNAVSCTMSLRMLSAVPRHSGCCQLYHVTHDAVSCTTSLMMLSAVPCHS